MNNPKELNFDEINAHWQSLTNSKQLFALAEKVFATNPSGRLASLGYLIKGDAFAYNKQYKEAIECYEEAIKIDPENAPAYNDKGNVLYNLKQYDKAIVCYDEAIRINPAYAIAYYNKGNALHGLRQYDKAIVCYDEAIRINPEDAAAAYNNKGNVLYNLKQYDKAIVCYDEAIRINPENATAYNGKGNALHGLKQYEKAIECYDKAIRIDPEYAMAYCNKGNALRKLTQHDKAIECYDKAIRIDPVDATTYYNKGNALYDLKQYDKAVEYYDEAIKRDPLSAMAYNNKGASLEETGKNEEAFSYYAKAFEIEPGESLYYNNKERMLGALLLLFRDRLQNTKNGEKKRLIDEQRKRLLEHEPDFKVLAGNDDSYDSSVILFSLQRELLGLLRAEPRQVGYYRSVSTFEKLIGSSGEKAIEAPCGKSLGAFCKKEIKLSKIQMRSLSSANDPFEGRILHDFLEAKYSEESEKWVALQASFTARIDNLTQFRFYGKKSDAADSGKPADTEGTGVCLVFDQRFFARGSDGKLSISRSSDSRNALQEKIKDLCASPLPQGLYWVLYYDQETKRFIFTPSSPTYWINPGNVSKGAQTVAENEKKEARTNAEKISTLLDDLKKYYSEIKNPQEKKAALEVLVFLRYLIKDAGFSDEQELRIIKLADFWDKDNCLKDDRGTVYMDYYDILDPQHPVVKVIAGPKVAEYRKKVDFWQYRIQKYYREQLGIPEDETPDIEFAKSKAPLA